MMVRFMFFLFVVVRVFLLWSSVWAVTSLAFQPNLISRCYLPSVMAATAVNDEENSATGSSISTSGASSWRTTTNMEVAWRYIKKPLLSIGAKGVVPSHATSLRDLLKSHTAVKVKIRHADGLEAGFRRLDKLLSDQHELELLHCRESDGIIMIGAKGTKDLIESGKFPPAKTPTTPEEEGLEIR